MIDGELTATFEVEGVTHTLSIKGNSESLPYDLAEFISVIVEYSDADPLVVLKNIRETIDDRE